MLPRPATGSLLPLAPLLLALPAAVQVHHVDASALPGGDGTTWATAFRHLNDALLVAQPGEGVWVAEGVYRPDEGGSAVAGDRAATFALPSGVEVLGGFTGVELDSANRLGLAANTILSGDLDGDDGVGFVNNAENSLHVVTATAVSKTTLLDGFTILAGHADGANDDAYGAGILVQLGSLLTISDCTIAGCQSLADGGGVFHTTNSNATFSSCVFENNASGVDGGGVMCTTSSSPLFSGCTFEGNVAARWGGAVRNAQAALPTYSSCEFELNVAGDSAGALWNDNAGITVEDCRFAGNSALNLGGAVLTTGSPTFTDCTFQDNEARRGGALFVLGLFSRPSFEACEFIGNEGLVEAGAVFNGGKPIFADCTFALNTTTTDGGALCTKGAGPELVAVGCRFEDNGAVRGGAVFNSGVGVCQFEACEFERNVADDRGGAMYHGEADISLTDCRFVQNESHARGGGVFLINLIAGGTLSRCTFERCMAQETGGGLYLTNSSSPRVEECLFDRNFARIHGAGVYNTSSEGAGGDSSGRFVRCRFTQNTCPEDGAAFFNATSVQGGVCSPHFVDCVFDANVAAKDGAAFYNVAFGGTASPVFANVRFLGNVCGKDGAAFHNTALSKAPNTFCRPMLQNCEFSGNISNNRGGAFYNDNRSRQPGNSNAVFSGCVMSRNSATASGGGVFNWHTRVGEADLTFRNTILWGNGDDGGVDESAQFTNLIGDPVVEYCCIEGWTGGGVGNTAANPVFLDPLGPDLVAGTLDDDLRLASASPLLDAGLVSGVLPDLADLDADADLAELTPLDADRRPRFVDVAAPDTGVGPGPIVDFGPYEGADCDGNGILDAEDVVLGAADCNGNHVPDLCEIDVVDGGAVHDRLRHGLQRERRARRVRGGLQRERLPGRMRDRPDGRRLQLERDPGRVRHLERGFLRHGRRRGPGRVRGLAPRGARRSAIRAPIRAAIGPFRS